MRPSKNGNCLVIKASEWASPLEVDEVVRLSDRTLRLKRHGSDKYSEVTFGGSFSIAEDRCSASGKLPEDIERLLTDH